LRHHVSAGIAEIRGLREAQLYEFGVDHEAHKAAGETVLRAALTSGSLFWNELAVLERTQDRDLATREKLLKIRSVLAKTRNNRRCRCRTEADCSTSRNVLRGGAFSSGLPRGGIREYHGLPL
jgi:hypothetical protein